MEYTEVDVRLQETNPFVDILIAKLNDIDFESYSENEKGVKAYVQTILFNKKAVKDVIDEIAEFTKLSYNITKVKQENWNQEWEKNFKPVHVNDKCVIRAHFHDTFSAKEYELIITPKMSFGTGHHETTLLMLEEMFNVDFINKSVLDIGTGTGILAILASKLGAKILVGIDIDKWAFYNSIENAALNNISNIEFIKGEVNKIKNRKFDIILVNISRNIILNDIVTYVNVMEKDSEILISGFLKDDISLILEKTGKLRLNLICLKNKNKWQMIHLKKY